MSCIISMIIGVVLGIPLGWAVLFCAADLAVAHKRRPPTKDEWKVM